ncbi:MAG TPA: CidA/LrgA family protein [Marmoricola sp.]|nr:CidA/LrgA family protein [Marmoricola sp.]HNI70928.1 CidA/LrgA family protein [Marmoricola sp.]HNJ78296.1 CidA/LrgA family protein [Marmoricola sp.]
MLLGLIAILTCQLVGEVIVRVLDLPIPGPVLGMVLMLIVLRVRRASPERGPVATAAAPLLKHLQLLFVPAGVGIVVLLEELRADWLPISVALWGSWLLGLVVTGWVVTLLIRLLERGEQ